MGTSDVVVSAVTGIILGFVVLIFCLFIFFIIFCRKEKEEDVSLKLQIQNISNYYECSRNLSLGCIGKKVLLKENKDQIIAHKITQNCLNKDPILILLPLMKEVKIGRFFSNLNKLGNIEISYLRNRKAYLQSISEDDRQRNVYEERTRNVYDVNGYRRDQNNMYNNNPGLSILF